MPRLKLLSSIILFLLLANLIFAEQEFFSPVEPPEPTLIFDIRFNDTDGIVSGEGTLDFTNDGKLPISVIALTSKSNTELNVYISGEKLKSNFAVDGKEFFTLPDTVDPGKSLLLEIAFTITELEPNDYDRLELQNFIPNLWWDDIPFHSTYKTKVEVPEGYVFVISGKLNPESGRYEESGIAKYGLIFAKGYHLERRQIGDVELSVLFNDDQKTGALYSLEKAEKILKHYQEWLGFYPYKSISIAPGYPKPYGGYPIASGVVIIHGWEEFDKKPEIHWHWITAHELGHEYWGDYVLEGQNSRWVWLGLGIYTDRSYSEKAGLTEKHQGMMDRYTSAMDKGYDTTVDIGPQQRRRIRFSFNSLVDHGKGYSIFHALESVLGRDEFFRIYKNTLKEFKGKRLGFRTLQAFFEKESGKDLDWFFVDWVRTNRYMLYETSIEHSQEGIEQISTVTVTQKGTMSMPVPVQFIFEDGSETRDCLNRFMTKNIFVLKSSSPVKQVILDPDNSFAILEKDIPLDAESVRIDIEDMEWTGSGRIALSLLDKAEKAKLKEESSWLKLGLILFESANYEDAKLAFSKILEFTETDKFKFIASVWLGHLADMQGAREQALEHYKAADAFEQDDFTFSHGQFDLTIDKEWVKQRLEKPFSWKKK